MTETALVKFTEALAICLNTHMVNQLSSKKFSEWGAMKLRNEVGSRREKKRKG